MVQAIRWVTMSHFLTGGMGRETDGRQYPFSDNSANRRFLLLGSTIDQILACSASFGNGLIPEVHSKQKQT